MHSVDRRAARRLALARAGLLKPEWTGLVRNATGGKVRARRAALAITRRFGYLQLDTVSIAGARSQAIVLMSRLRGVDPDLAERLLRPGEPLFEYWGHEACYMPLELFPLFNFRRKAFRDHPWWGAVVGKNPKVADELMRRIRDEGPLRSLEMEGRGSRGWWDLKLSKRVATALWSSGDLAIRERKNFQRSFDLPERVIPSNILSERCEESTSYRELLLQALRGHGWATIGTLEQTWRLRNRRPKTLAALRELEEAGEVVRCQLTKADGRPQAGWIRPSDLDLSERLRSVRPPRDVGVLLSPFDPVLWDRGRVDLLFGFEQLLEIFKPAPARRYGYYCLPVLAGDELVGRVDLKADRKAGRLHCLSTYCEEPQSARGWHAIESAVQRFSGQLGLETGSLRPDSPRAG